MGVDKGRRGFYAQPCDLVVEVMADVLRAIIMTDGQASGDILADGPKAFPQHLGGSAVGPQGVCRV